MSMVGWCWLAWFVYLTIVGVRCIRRAIAMLGEWADIASKITNTMEGDHGADQETR